MIVGYMPHQIWSPRSIDISKKWENGAGRPNKDQGLFTTATFQLPPEPFASLRFLKKELKHRCGEQTPIVFLGRAASFYHLWHHTLLFIGRVNAEVKGRPLKYTVRLLSLLVTHELIGTGQDNISQMSEISEWISKKLANLVTAKKS